MPVTTKPSVASVWIATLRKNLYGVEWLVLRSIADQSVCNSNSYSDGNILNFQNLSPPGYYEYLGSFVFPKFPAKLDRILAEFLKADELQPCSVNAARSFAFAEESRVFLAPVAR